MENVYDCLADDDDEDCQQLIKQGKRSRRLVISDEEDEKENCEVVNNGFVASLSEDTKTSDPDPVGERVDPTDNSGVDATDALSTTADSETESVEYDLAADVRQSQLSTTSTPADHSLLVRLTSSDIFDDDVSDGGGCSVKDSCTDVREDRSDDTADSNDDENDNGFDENQVDPTLMAKLKRMKGASRCGQGRQKYSRKAKPQAEEMMEIYSESQRLLRDSRVSLPYHQPQPKLLDDFLARAAQKKQVYAGLQKARDIQKARVISDRLSISPTLVTSDKHRPKCASVQHERHGSTSKTTPDCQRNTTNGRHSSVPMSSVECISKCVALSGEKSGIDTLGTVEEDELPDLCLVSASSEPTDRLTGKECDMKSREKQPAAAVISTDDISHADSHQTPHLRKDPSRDLFKSQNSQIDENEQPQNSMTEENELPQNSLTEENELPQKSLTEENELPQNSMTVENELPQNSLTEENELPQNSMTVENELPQNSMIEENELPQNSLTEENEQPQSLRGQQLHICGTADVNCTVENNIRDGHSSSECLDVRDSATIHKNVNFKDSISVNNDCTNNLGHTNTVCSSQSLTSPASGSNSVSDCSSMATPVTTASRRKLLDRLQGVSLTMSPSLSATPDGIICLDDAEPVSVVKDAGLLKLMNRLVKHSMKTSTTPVAGSVEERSDPGAAHVNVESGESAPSSGYKLEQLKHQLGIGMKEKRVEARQRRFDQFALDNEQGFGEEEEEELEFVGSDTDDDDDEEVEEARPSDTDEDEDEDCNINMETNDSDDDDYTPYLDAEAHDEDTDDDDDENKDEQDESSDVCLHFDVSDEEEQTFQGTENDGEKMENRQRTNKSNPHLSSSEEDCGEDSRDTVIIPSSSNNNLDSDGGDSDDATKMSEKTSSGSSKKRPGVVSSLGQSSSQTSPVTAFLQDPTKQTDFRGENSKSPDLYSTRMDDQNLRSRSQLSHSTDTTSHMTETNLIKYLDDDGFIKISQTQQTSRVFLLPQTQTSDSVDVSKVFEGTSQMSAGHIFHGLATPASGNVEHHIVSSGQSSGTFIPYRRRVHDDDDVVDPFHVLSDSEDNVAQKSQKQDKAAFSDDDDASKDDDDAGEVDDDDDDASEIDDAEQQCDTDDKKKGRSQLTQPKKKNTFRLTDFVEDEAELSGSEYDTDEDVDVAEEDDILEEEAGDQDLLGVSQERLRDEVGRLHMKQLRDDDDRAVMRYKEMYLQDGDLYSEGAGRLRNFRWKDVEYQSQQETVGYNSDEGLAEEDAEDAHWRKDRFEREQFLEKKDCGPDTDECQLIKLGQFFLKKQESIPHATDNVIVSSMVKSSLTMTGHPKVQRKGSFLSRGTESLGKLAEVVQTTHAGHAGKNSRNFLFQTVDGPKDDDDDKTDTSQSSILGKRKAHTMCTSDTSKKAKLANTSCSTSREKTGQSQRHSSIFDLFADV